MMRERLQRFMQGRYGSDGLNKALGIGAAVFFLIGVLFSKAFFSWIGWLLLILTYFRAFSRNIPARYQENLLYYEKTAPLRAWLHQKMVRFRLRGQYRYYRCPMCKQDLRVPRGHGKIAITCPKCNYQFIKKS